MHRHTHSHNHSQGSLPRGRPVIPEEGAKASDWFEQFLTAPTLKTIFGSYRNICEYLHLKPNVLPLFYPKLKNHINSWKAKPLWKKFDTRANQKCYGRGKACPHTRVLIIGAGPCGLRTAIEAQLLGAKVVVVEKRDRMSRNNVLHLWPFVIDDLRALGAKKFFGKFCAGSIDHISIRQLQCILLKVALLLGVEIHTEVSFERLIEPNPNEKTGWRAEFKPAEHPVSQFEFDVIIGADGKRNTLQGFKRKEFRGKLAIAITANFINKRTEAEARVEEISGVAFIFNQKFFKDLYAETGIDLENIVYYKDDTHYFVMTAKKQSLIDKGVIKEDLADTARLLAPDNVDREELMNYAREAAEFSTNYQMPDLEFAVNHYGHPDVAMFDFTSMYAAENASRVIERHNYKLLSILVGDSLLEPFWPTGSGCARGFLSSMDAAWAIRSWDSDTVTPLEVIAERESIYRLLAQTTPENLNKDYKSYTLDPSTRYPNLNKNALLAHQVTNLYDTDDPKSIELNPRPAPAIVEVPKKRRRRESHVDPDTLLSWIKEQVREHEDLEVTNLTTSFRDGRVLCAIISHYRPDLLDYSAINAHDFVRNNQVVFDLLEKELGVPPIMTGEEMAENDSPDFLTMLAYLTKVYDTFRCEIPHIKYPKWDMPEVKRTENVFKIRTNVDKTDIFASTVPPPRPSSRHKRHVDTSFLNKPSTALSQDRKARKRKTLEKVGASVEDRQRRLEDIVSNRVDRHNKRRQQRKMQTEQFIKSMQMLHSNCKPDHSEPFEDYSIYLYRQTAPNFEDRVKNLEKQFIYVPDKESRVVPAQTKRETDEDFAARIKDLEDKWREPVSVEKKPKDLLRAIGKIETSDWNIKEIEKKIIENKLGKTVNKDKEKVPKWSREQFLARQTKMERQHIDRQNSTEVKFADIDRNIKQLELKLKEGSVRDLNQHKVASITEKLVGKTTEPPTTTAQSSKPIQKSSSRTVIPISQGSEFCHFCSKRVYLVERLTAEGRIFHTGCFRCQYCHTSLRLGTYMFDREGLYEHRFYCAQHFGMPGEISRPEKKVVEIQETPQKKIVSNVLGVDLLDRVQTPERIEFSNLSTGHISSDHDESPSPIDEDEWTDRNNINSVVDSDSSDDSSSTSDTDSDDEAYEEALEEPITKEGTLRWAERYKKRYSRKDHESNSDGYSSSDHFSYYENSSGDDDSDTATEGEEEIRARELRKQEVRVEPPIDAGTDTEVKPLSNYPFDSNDSNLVSNQTPCTVDMPDILNNTLKVSKSSDNMSSTNEQFNSAESELDDMYKHEMRDIRNQEPPTPNSLSKSSTTSSISSTPVKRNFVLPPKERRSSFGKEFVPVVEQEPLLVIKRTPSKINLPPEIGKPKVQVKTNVDSAKKYFGELRKPFISKPPIDKSKKPPIIKQASLPERSTITVAHAQNKEESKEGRRESIFNFEPEENDLEEIDNYIENLMKGEKQVLHPVKAGKNEDEREEEKVSSSIEDLLKALEVETNVEENEIVEVKPEEKIEDLLNWIEELDHKAEDSHITSSLKPDKYKNLENVLKKPREVDNVIHKLSKDNITQFENHLLGKNQKVPEDNNDNYQLSKSKTDVNCNKPRNSVDLDAVKKVDIKKVLEKFENNEGQQQDFKQPRRSIVVPKNIVKRNSFANFSFNRSFEKDDKQPMYDQHRDSIGSKDFKMRAEMFEKKLKRFDDQNDETRFNPSQEGFEGNSRRSPLSWKVNQLKSNSQSPHRTNDDSLGRSSSLLRRFEIKASSESPQRSKNTSVVDQSGKPAFLKVNDSSPHRKDRDTSPSFLRKFPHLKLGSKSPNRVADNDGNLNEGVSFLEKSISSSKLLSGKTEDATGDSDDDSLKSPSLLKKILELESIRRHLQNTETTPVADGHNLNKSPVALKELDEIKPEIESKPKSIVNLVENISFLQPKTDSSQRTEDEVNLCRITSETGQDDDGNNLADINLGSRLDESNAHKSTEIDNAFSGTPFLQNLSQIPDDRNSFYDKIQLDQLLTNTRQTKDEIVGNNHRETINSENKSDGKLESNSESNAGQGNNGNDLDFYDITLDNEAQSPVRENYFQALVTVKNIIKNLNLQQETGLNPNTEIEIQPNAIEPGFNEDVSIKGENIIDEGNREGINLDNAVECAGDIESNLQRKENVYQEVNDDSVLKGNENRNENIENKLEDGSICEKIEPNIDKVIEEKNQVHRSSVKKQNVVDSKKLNKKPSLEFVTVEKHPLLTEKPSSSIIIDLPKIQLVESTNTNKKETSPRPVPPQRSKKEHISMIPRLTNPHASKNFIRPQQSSIRAASASPGVSRRMETAFAPVPPVRKKSSTSTAAPNLGDKNMELNQTKLNERSTSADNLGTSKRQSDTLRGKLFSKSKEKECSIQ